MNSYLLVIVEFVRRNLGIGGCGVEIRVNHFQELGFSLNRGETGSKCVLGQERCGLNNFWQHWKIGELFIFSFPFSFLFGFNNLLPRISPLALPVLTKLFWWLKKILFKLSKIYFQIYFLVRHRTLFFLIN